MAIDTAAKRASVISYATERAPLRPPDTIDSAGERAHIAFAYAGIDAGAPAALDTGSHVDRRRRLASVYLQHVKGGSTFGGGR
jgi:hypothetical protein